jgi:hypothetical protein
MVLDIFNSLRRLVFQEIKHFVFPILVMFSWHVFLTTESEFLKNKRGFCQGNIQKQKYLSFFTQVLLYCSYRYHFDTYFSQVHKARIVGLMRSHFWN